MAIQPMGSIYWLYNIESLHVGIVERTLNAFASRRTTVHWTLPKAHRTHCRPIAFESQLEAVGTLIGAEFR